jgi:hypothetical protein
MLTTGGRRGRLSARAVVGLVAGAALVAAALVAPPASAQPGDLPPCADFTIVDGEPVIDYSNCEGPGGSSGGGSGGGGTGGGAEPTCDWSLIEGRGEARWCEGAQGEYACWANVPSAVYPEPEDWPADQPSEDSVYIYKYCYGPDGTRAYSEWTWYTPDEPSIQELAWEAYGRLVIPEFRLAFNPSEQAIIFVDTWWWAEGAGDGAVRGSSAAGLVAVAEPDRLEVDPGDGSGTIVCGWVTAKSDTCTHAYQKASAGGYPARARLVYGVHFEQNGQVLDVPGLPDTLESGWEETTVPVHEVQAIVR